MIYIALSALLYWTEVPLIGLALLIAGQMVGYKKEGGRIQTYVPLAILMAVASWLIGFATWQGELEWSPSLFSVLHFSILLLVVSNLSRTKFTGGRELLCWMKIYGSVMVLAAVLAYGGVCPDFLFVAGGGVPRFEFVFREPSYLGLYNALLFGWILTETKKLDAGGWCAMSAIFLTGLLSLSGGGGIVLIFVVLSQWRRLLVNRRGLLLSFVTLLLIVPALLPLPFDEGVMVNQIGFVESRLERLISGQADMSARIRFIAPWHVMSDVLSTHTYFGVGFGWSETYLWENWQMYPEFQKINPDGTLLINPNIDNVFYYVIINTGVVGFLIFLVIIFKGYWGRLGKKSLRFTLLLTVMLFSGAIIHPLFALWVQMSMNKLYGRQLSSATNAV